MKKRKAKKEKIKGKMHRNFELFIKKSVEVTTKKLSFFTFLLTFLHVFFCEMKHEPKIEIQIFNFLCCFTVYFTSIQRTESFHGELCFI